MSSLRFSERQNLENAFGMSSGYVLNFSDRTFNDFVQDAVGVDIYSGRYSASGTSKAKILREFWKIESDQVVADLLESLREHGVQVSLIGAEQAISVGNVIARLREHHPVSDLDAIRPNANEPTFDLLARAARKAIDDGRPGEGLDRLHTFITKFLRVVCERRGINATRDKPLHSLMGEYVKALRATGLLSSEMTELILKSSISTLAAFSDVRNNQSLAHDNTLLANHEALYIFSHVASLVRFLQVIDPSTRMVDQFTDVDLPAK